MPSLPLVIRYFYCIVPAAPRQHTKCTIPCKENCVPFHQSPTIQDSCFFKREWPLWRQPGNRQKEKALRFRRAFVFGELKGTLPRTFRQSAGLSDPAGTQTGRTYGLRCPHRTAPHGRNLSSATAAPAPAPCFRRRRRSPAQLFSSLSEAAREQTKKEKALRFRRAFILVR